MAYVAQPQTSRAGLISTIVILSILTVLSTVFLFITINDRTKVEQEYKRYVAKYAPIISDTSAGADLDALKATAHDKGVKVFDIMAQNRDALSEILNGQPLPNPEAEDRARGALKLINDDLRKLGVDSGVTVTSNNNNLVDAVSKWQPIVHKLLSERDELTKKIDVADKARQEDVGATESKLKQKDQQVADVQKQLESSQASYKELQDKQTAALKDVQDQAAQSSQQTAADLNDAKKAVAAKEQELGVRTKERDRLRTVLRRFKQMQPSTKDPMVRIPAGKVTLVNNDECFIDLGDGDQVPVGMTFEVYDPNRGIPQISTDNGPISPTRKTVNAAVLIGAPGTAARKDDDRYEQNLPTGKGSIEVTAVGPGKVARCRIIHVEPGQVVTQGDVIANLIYNKSIKFAFFVYGDFDLSNGSGNGRQNDIGVIRRLVEQWGSRVQPIADPKSPVDSLNMETDFIVLGKPPVIPTFTPDELQNASNQNVFQAAKDKAALYDAILGKASEYGIPVLNQNRFLYYVGYFDQARR